jgi:L-ascorbate metabolism protein UlaG (beta-lactamase superfamily)
MNPDEAARAARDLQSRRMLPAHVGRFTLANHPWDEPFRRLAASSDASQVAVLTPKIGEPLYLQEQNQGFSRWWEGIE